MTKEQQDSTAVFIPRWFLGAIGLLFIPAASLAGWMVMQVTSLDGRMTATEVARSEIRTSLNDQTQEIIELRLQIERLLVIKPADVYRKLEELERKLAERQE